MLDDRNTGEGDEVTKFNEATWRKKFCEETGHSMQCVEETVNEMAQLVSKVCHSFGIVTVDEFIEKAIGVEKFDKHLREILNDKKCNCKKNS